MKYIADFHIHSPFSRATSPASNLVGLFAWAQVKGIHLIGTGDFTHPGWMAQMKELLTPAEPGFFRLQDEKVAAAFPGAVPEAIQVRFLLTAEISSIYKRHGKVRKVHNLLFVPDFASAERINAKLAAIGNIESDGRPILGLDSRDLLEILLEQAPDGFLVPAHIWTPWFSLFGSKSGFDDIEECYGDLTDHIFALETGLSSDPDMNRMVSALDRFTMISNSDCHSPSKLGREVNLFDATFDFFSIREALKNPGSGGFKGTLEFFPEEGKYHSDGHRKCGVCLDPLETKNLNDSCPVCNRPLTIGVNHRVMELADRDMPFYPEGQPAFQSIIPLPEVLGEMLGRGPATKGVQALYGKVINRFGSEFNIFLNTPKEELDQFSPVLGEAISRIRTNKVIRKAGYDGEFGVIHVFEEGELDAFAGQISLFSGVKRKKKNVKKKALQPSLFCSPVRQENDQVKGAATLNQEQQRAVSAAGSHILVTAGPGTGKTHTLIERILHLLTGKDTDPETICAITFTNKAADELKKRLTQKAGSRAEKIFVGTFHSFCLEWLKKDQPSLTVAGEDDRAFLLKRLFAGQSKKERQSLAEAISLYWQRPEPQNTHLSEKISAYLRELESLNLIDIEAIIPTCVAALQTNSHLRGQITTTIRHLFVDEFQDVNESQYRLVAILAESATVFAIGDPDQAIYGFRGSNLRYFFDFAHSSPQGTPIFSVALKENYRSAPCILEAAAHVIKNNNFPDRAPLIPQGNGKGRIEYFQAATPAAEAECVVKRIEEIMGGVSHFSINSGRGGSHGAAVLAFSDIAVLYRLNSQADHLHQALAQRGIPCQRLGAKPYYLTGDYSKIYYWLLAAAGDASIAEHINLLKKLCRFSAAIIAACEMISPTAKEFFAAARQNTTGRSLEQLSELAAEIHAFRKAVSTGTLVTSLARLFDQLAVNREADDAKRFLELAGIFGQDLPGFTRHLKDNAASAAYDDRAEAVTLMTIHAAKGLEFDAVFICGLEEGLFPYHFGGRACDIAEERRLFYVAMTRAKERLFLSSAASRSLWGQNLSPQPCRFVHEIQAKLVTVNTEAQPSKKRQPAQLSLF